MERLTSRQQRHSLSERSESEMFLGESTVAGDVRGRATVRHVTPYLFVTKEVIYSESVLLHGLEKSDTAWDIIATMPYFLRAIEESTGIDEQRLRQLKRVLEKEEAKERGRAASESTFKRRASGLLLEAQRIGIAAEISEEASEASLVRQLEDDFQAPTRVSVLPGRERAWSAART